MYNIVKLNAMQLSMIKLITIQFNEFRCKFLNSAMGFFVHSKYTLKKIINVEENHDVIKGDRYLIELVCHVFLFVIFIEILCSVIVLS